MVTEGASCRVGIHHRWSLLIILLVLHTMNHLTLNQSHTNMEYAEYETAVELVPPKKNVNTNFSQCIICQKNTPEILKNGQPSSVKNLELAIELRSNDVYDRLGDNIVAPPDMIIMWHASCYASWTSKENLSHIKLPKTVASLSDCVSPKENDSSSWECTRISRSQSTTFDSSKCIFCKNKTHKKVKDMFNVSTTATYEKIIDAAEAQGDEAMLLLLRGNCINPIDANIKYHKACHSTYTSKSNLKYCGLNEKTTDNMYADAFIELCSSIKPDLRNGKAYDMGTLLSWYQNLLDQRGVASDAYTKQKLKSRMQNFFGSDIVFYQPQKTKPEIVFSSEISMTDVLNTAFSHKSEHQESGNGTETDETTTDDDSFKSMLYKVAKLIRSDIDQCNGINIKPLNVHNITNEQAKELIPPNLYWLMRWIVAADKKGSEEEFQASCHNMADERRIISICQDVLHCASHARVKTPKHTSLAMTIRHLTGSKQLITILNRLGNCSSYDDIEVMDTCLAKETLAKADAYGAIIPTNIMPNAFVQVAADNNDINEETLDGKNTTHVTTLVMFQRGQFGPMPQRRIYSESTKRQRSLDDPGTRQPILEFGVHGKRPDVNDYLGNVTENCLHYRDRCYLDAINMDMAWAMTRMCPTKLFDVTLEPIDPTQQKVPGWSGFHALVSANVPLQTEIGYCPIIDGSPTEYSTVYTVLTTVQKMMESLNQRVSVITFDLAIYSKAKEIQWRLQEDFTNTVIRLGGFHIALNYLATLGKKYEESGIEDLLIESGLYGGNTTTAVLKGRSYNRGVRCHKLVLECLFRLQWKSFVEWMSQAESNLDENYIIEQIEVCKNACETGRPMHDIADALPTIIAPVVEQFQQFKDESRAKSAMFAYWDDYITMVTKLLQFIKAERTGDWLLHLSATVAIIPEFFAMDRPNYSRWLPVYVMDMHSLEQQHPEVYQEFINGNHSVSRSDRGFAQVWTDMALEQSINLDSKSKGGIIGISKKQAALDRWFLTIHDMAAITAQVKSMTGLQDVDKVGTHKEGGPTRIRRDEEDVQKLSSIFAREQANNPFTLSDDLDASNPQPLTNLTTGVVMPRVQTERLLQTSKIGQELMEKFVEDRLNSHDTPFWDKLPRVNISTFATMTKRRDVKTTEDKVLTMKADRQLFGRLLIAANRRSIDLKEILAYELSPVPLSLAHNDGSLRRTAKSVLLNELESNVDVIARLPPSLPAQSSAKIIDGMAQVHMLGSANSTTFGDLAVKHFEYLMALFDQHDCTRVDLIFDQYKENTIKAGERQKRSSGPSIEIVIHGKYTPIPKQWNKYIGDQKNKMNLCLFLSEQLCEMAMLQMKPGDQFVLAGGFCDGTIALLTTNGHMEVINELASDQEEADTRLLLHAAHAASDHQRIIIYSPDTDVAVLCVSLFGDLTCQELWLRTGTKDRLRYIPCHSLAEYLGEGLCAVLPAFHAITGCDSTSSFSGIGKKKSWKLVQKHLPTQVHLQHFGRSVDIDESSLRDAETAVCRFYTVDPKAGTTADEVRHWLFCQKRPNSESLPPTTDCLWLHLRRANYQTHIWRNALQAVVNLPNPDGHGWHMEDRILTPLLMTKDAAPVSLVELVACQCKKSSCSTTRCTCRVNELACTEACACMADEQCKNPLSSNFEESDDSDIE